MLKRTHSTGMLFLLKDKCFFKTHPRVTTKVYGYQYSESAPTMIGAIFRILHMYIFLCDTLRFVIDSVRRLRKFNQ